MTPKAILFDFDGVIAETENHHIAAWQRTLGAMGWQVADEVAARAVEVDDREFLADLFTARGIPVDKVDEWVERKQELTVQLLRYCAAGLSGGRRAGRGAARQGAAGGGLGHLAGEHQDGAGGRGAGRLVRRDRRQGGRDAAQARPGAVS